MSIWRMIWQEIAHRKLNFILGLFSVVVAIATLAGVLTLLEADQIRAAESGKQLDVQSEKLNQSSQQLEEAAVKLDDEMRKITKGLGFNILILNKDEDLHAMNLTGVPQKTIPEANVTTLAESDIITINHLLPVVTQRIKWEEQDNYELLLTGTRGEVPQAHRALKKPLQAQVPKGTMIVGSNVAEQRNFKVGQKVKLKGLEFEITKIQKPQGDLPDSTVWINLKEAQEMLGMQNIVNAILALECNCATIDRLAEIQEDVKKWLPGTQVIEKGTQALARAKARNQAKASAEENKKIAQASKEAAESNHQVALENLKQHEDLASLLTPLVFLGCGVWIAGLSLVNVRQRSEEIGILRAIGWRSRQIMGLFLGKAVILGLVGAILGYVLGFVGIAAWGNGALDQSQLFNQWFLAGTLLLAPLLSAVASWIPALTAAKNDPAIVLQGQ